MTQTHLPQIFPIDKIEIGEPEIYTLSNGIKVYGFPGAKNEILSIELLFDAGRWTEEVPLCAGTCARLIKSGSDKLSAFELSESIDYYGSTIKASAGYNSFALTLYSMHRYLESSLELFGTCLQNIIFPENEISLYKQNSLAKYKVEIEKNDYLADMAFKKMIFGDKHPYGYDADEKMIGAVEQKHLLSYYKNAIRVDNCNIILAGKYDASHISMIDKYLGTNVWQKAKNADLKTWEKIPSDNKNYHLNKPDAVQSAIIIGKEMFNMSHPDYAEFVLLNTIFGGYFGSRLMANIREDKGYTYGIHSSLQPYKYGGVFSIQTEVGKEHLSNTLKEIDIELDKIQTELITAKELILARNYLLGKFLSRTDGPFNKAEQFKKYLIEGMPITSFGHIVEKIKNTEPSKLRDLAQQYFNCGTFYKVTIG